MVITRSSSLKPKLPSEDMSTPTETKPIRESLKKFLGDPSSFIKTIPILESNGSNLEDWTRGINRILNLVFHVANFCAHEKNFLALDEEENAGLRYIIQASVHRDLASLIDEVQSAYEAFEIIHNNFRPSTRFRTMELLRELLDIYGNQKPDLAAHFGQVFRIYSDLGRIGVPIPPILEGFLLQVLTSPPPGVSPQQMFDSVSLKLTSQTPSAREVQSAINSFISESNRYHPQEPADPITAFWANASNSPGDRLPQSSMSFTRQPRQPPHQPWPSQQQPQPNPNRRPPTVTVDRNLYPPPDRQTLSRLSAETGRNHRSLISDFNSAVLNIQLGNKTPSQSNLARYGNTCEYCTLHGHWRSFCPKLRRDFGLPAPTGSAPPRQFARSATHNEGHQSLVQSTSALTIEDTQSPQINTVHNTPSHTMALDSGATVTVSGYLPLLSNLQILRTPLKLSLASPKSSMLATHSATLTLTNGQTFTLLNNVLFCPDMTGTLVSLAHLISSGFTPSFTPSHNICLSNNHCRLQATFTKNSWLFVEPFISPIAKATPPLLNQIAQVLPPDNQVTFLTEPLSFQWHKRLGHASDHVVKSFLKLFVPSYNPKSWSNFFCDSCKMAKGDRRRVITPDSIPKNSPRDLLVSDVFGPCTPDVFGNKYILTIRDHASTYSFTYPLKSREQVSPTIIQVVTKLKARFGTTAKFFRCDNAQEYKSKPLLATFADLGVEVLYTSPYTPEQNGEAERLNQTLNDMARTFLLDSKLPPTFWTLAWQHAVFIHNRIPNTRTASSTPLQLWCDTTPNPSQLYPFGARAIIHAPKATRSSKFAPRGMHATLVGFQPDARAWRFYIKATNTFLHSDAALFPDFHKQLPQAAPLPSPATASCHPNILSLNLTLGDEHTEETCSAQDNNLLIPQIPDPTTPTSLTQALSSPMAHEWRSACAAELAQLDSLKVWTPCPRTPTMKVISAKWVFSIKRAPDNSVERYKARYVARGFNQIVGIDCFSTFAPTSSLSSLRILLTIGLTKSWTIQGFDVSAAYLHSPITEDVYVEPPPQLALNPKTHVMKLNKALYGTKQAGRCWWTYFRTQMAQLGFQCDELEQSLYKYQSGTSIVIFWLHVDDATVFSNDSSTLQRLRSSMEISMKLKWMEKVTKIVGINFTDTPNSLHLSQEWLAKEIVQKYERENSKPLLYTYTTLPDSPLVTATTSGINPTSFRSYIGSLIYLSQGTRPDIAYSVNLLARFASNPDESHWHALAHLLGYIKRTSSQKLSFDKAAPKTNTLQLWTDANWGGEFGRSQTGYILTLNNQPVAWGSKRQPTVATSTCAAEYIALATSSEVLVSFIPLISSLLSNIKISLHCDNKAAVLVLSDNTSRGKMKTICRSFFSVNDIIRKHNISLEWVKGTTQLADIMTKRLGPSQLQKNKNLIHLPARFEGEC